MSYGFIDLREALKQAVTRGDIERIWARVQRDMKPWAWKEASVLVYDRYNEIRALGQKTLEVFM